MDRKSFIRSAAAGALVSIPVVSLLSCSSSDDGAPPNSNPNPPSAVNCLQNGTNTSVATSAGHSHSFTVPKEDVNAAVEKTYQMSNVSGHIHMVTISAAQFQTLKGNSSISASSTSDDGHTHGVTVSCA